MKKNFTIALVIIVTIILIVIFRLLTGAVYQKENGNPIDPSGEPIQVPVDSPESVPIVFRDGRADLTKVAMYDVSARICGRQKYSRPWQSYVAPYDLCLAWGDVGTKDIDAWLSFSQDMRWYHFRLKRDAPVSVPYVTDHTANMHLIYANANLKKAVSRLKKNDLVRLRGYLVTLKGTYKLSEIFWNSSLSRVDTGNGACEVMYLESMKIGDRLYR